MSSGSFSFCGVDVASIGLNYAPDLSETYVYRPSDYSAQIETFESHPGGYYYGSAIAPKTFVLRCYFENSNIDKGIMARMYSLFKAGKSGKLVFTRRPWCYYYATVADPIQTDLSNYMNGVVTITMTAAYPFARSNIITNTRTEKYHDIIMANSAVFDHENMELPLEYDLTQAVTEANPIILANPGTERAALGIAISGDVGDGVIIENKTTNQRCKIVALTKELSTNVNKYVLVDPINGKTTLVGAGESVMAFKYHEFGFLELESGFPATRNLLILNADQNSIQFSNRLKEDLSGKYIFLDDAWYKIAEQEDERTIILEENIPEITTYQTTAMIMNEIIVNPITTMDIHLKFIFKPTYA